MMAVHVAADLELSIGDAELLFEGSFEPSRIPGLTNYDVSRDGRFLTVEPTEHEPRTELNVVLNWFSEIERLVPTEN